MKFHVASCWFGGYKKRNEVGLECKQENMIKVERNHNRNNDGSKLMKEKL